MKIRKRMSVHAKAVRTIQTGLVLAMLTVGFYPKVSDAWNRYVADRQISNYVSASENTDTTEIDRLYESAQEYNEKLYEGGTNHLSEYIERIKNTGGGISDDGLSMGTADDPDYESQLSLTDDGVIGTIDIDKISVHLPIYHYTTDEVLAKGIGHLYGSSLPVGGQNTRAVLTGHRGLPSMELFTDLDKVHEGDTFTLTILGHTLTYEVSEIETILPEELEDLSIRKGEDLVSLVTCTPYGVNTHRLVVTGRRISNPAENVKTAGQTVRQAVKAPVFIMGCAAAVYIAAAVFLVYIWIVRR